MIPRALLHALLMLVLLAAGLTSALAAAPPPDAVAREARELQRTWTEIFYLAPRHEHLQKYQALLPKVRALKAQYPGRAEPLIVEAIVLCTTSAADLGLDTLELLEESRRLLQKAIDIQPSALDGAAFVTLGNLYRRLPGWPVLYGDKELARRTFETGLRLFPNGIDTNYFYGDFLLEAGETEKAKPYLEHASQLAPRPTLKVSDQRLHEESLRALSEIREGTHKRSDFFGLFTPSFR